MITVGRTANNDVCIPLASISKFHASFSLQGGIWRLTDQRSTNGTFVDDRRLQPAEAVSLADGTRIAFGPDTAARFFTPGGLFDFLRKHGRGGAI